MQARFVHTPAKKKIQKITKNKNPKNHQKHPEAPARTNTCKKKTQIVFLSPKN